MRVLQVIIFASINGICHHYRAKTSLHKHKCIKTKRGPLGKQGWLLFHNEYFQNYVLLLDILQHQWRGKKNLIYVLQILRCCVQISILRIQKKLWTEPTGSAWGGGKMIMVLSYTKGNLLSPVLSWQTMHVSVSLLLQTSALFCPSGWQKGQTGWTWAVDWSVMDGLGHVGCWAARCLAPDKCLCFKF